MQTRAQSGRGEVLPLGDHDTTDEECSEASPVLALDQIRSIHVSNEYLQGPVGPGWTLAPTCGSEGPVNGLGRSGASRSTSDASHSTARASIGSTSSDQRLLGNVGGTSERSVVRVQPKRSEVKKEELKPLHGIPGEQSGSGGGSGGGGKHSKRCARCGRCRCEECKAPRPLPACWLCSQRCLCSPESAVDYATCVCCLKALFYHCCNDDEDDCADKPFSCRQPHCCLRWGVAGALTLVLPCLLCYLPARGCLAVCQACYDHTHRPGCRCRHGDLAHCKSTDT